MQAEERLERVVRLLENLRADAVARQARELRAQGRPPLTLIRGERQT